MSIDYAILSAISSRPSTGYEIKLEFEHEGQGLIWGVSQGSIYTRLQVLERQELIEICDVETEGRHRKVYDLTGKGWQALMAWLKEPPEYPVVKDELLLKLGAWMDPNNRDMLIQHLYLRKARSKQLLDYFEAWPRNGVSSVGEYGGLVIEYVRGQLKAELDWIDSTVLQLQGPPHPPAQDPESLIQTRIQRRDAALSKLSQGDGGA